MSIHDDSLNNFITEITGGHWAWIGGVRTGQGPRDFSWEDGSKWNYTNWKSGQPDNFGYIPYSPLDSSKFRFAASKNNLVTLIICSAGGLCSHKFCSSFY